MALRKIVEQGEDCLYKVCRPVTDFNKRLHILLDDMTETLVAAGGAGLAAPQVGILRRICIVMQEDTEEYVELINPKIVSQKGSQTGPEGCLSVPGKWGLVTRPSWVQVRAQDRFGNWFNLAGEGLTARCFCHELEHLEGHTYDEHVDRLYTAEEVDAMMEEEEQEKPKRGRRRKR